MATYKVSETTTVKGVEVKISNEDGSWFTRNFQVATLEEANESLRILSLILLKGQNLTATIY